MAIIRKAHNRSIATRYRTPAQLMNNEIILYPADELQPATLFTPTPNAARRVLEFFTAQINNDHTRMAYLNATRRFAHWCDARGITELAASSLFMSPPLSRTCRVSFRRPRSSSTWPHSACCSIGW